MTSNIAYFWRFLVFFSSLIVVVACEAPRERPLTGPTSFSKLSKINLDVAKIDVKRIYKAPLKSPYIEHEMPNQLLDAAERWAKDRLRAVGKYGVASLTIDQASVVEVKLEKVGGIRGAFTNNQGERYDVVLSVGIEVLKAANGGQAAARTTVRASRTISENATIAERERLWEQMNNDVMGEFNKAFEARLRKHLSAFLR
ncbi:MAG: hypothetical protein VX941_01940 [Pseudomonadota bacterium]|nr:hypothetical protein [Pseudomonadota bacterium]